MLVHWLLEPIPAVQRRSDEDGQTNNLSHSHSHLWLQLLMVLDCRRGQENLKRTQSQGRTCKLHKGRSMRHHFTSDFTDSGNCIASQMRLIITAFNMGATRQS